MSELCISKSHFSSLLISDFLILLCSTILSHPLYFSYLIFFSPYLLKLLSFLSPLFLTTSLISLAFLQTLHLPNEDLQSCELYEIFFGPPSTAEVREDSHQTPQKDPILEPIPLPGPAGEAPIAGAGKSKTPAMEEDSHQAPQKDPILEPIPLPGLAGEAPIAVAGKSKTPAMEEEKRLDDSVIMDGLASRSNSVSMRREREWRRTLAGKLFEERHSGGGGGGEGMDSLWEAHEMDSKKSGVVGRRKKVEVEEEEEGENEIEMCCLQALKMSAGKMSLGVGRPSLVRISKAIKGIGWLHLHKSSKKVHNNGDHR